ncbi:type IV secretion system DNA-binding domain-containing protein [Campylobacter upsaliensis]|nr:type IV secretion system DNA-binding domain-containing protein [Campylobacter upsaliensis]
MHTPTFLKRLKKKKELPSHLKKKSLSFFDFFKEINQGADKLLMLKEPKIFSLSEENNIICKYKQHYILTKDGNLSCGVELKGVSYSALSLEDELKYLETRINFFTKLHPQIEMNIIIKKEKVLEKNYQPLEHKNPYTKEIISKWQSNASIYKIRYFLMISTINKTLTGLMESFKDKTTKEKSEENKSEANLKNKLAILEETFNQIKSRLAIFNPRLMQNDEVINFYATYCNANKTKLKYSHEALSDSYLSSDLEFKKSHFIFETNEGKKIFARFISIKAYEGDNIQSLMTSNLLKNDNEFMIFIHLTPYHKDKAIKYIKDSGTFAQAMIKEEYAILSEQIKADKENLVQMSYSMLIQAESEKELEEKTNALKTILENQNLNIVRESLNQKALYFSFFPSRGNLNARKKCLKVSNLATITTFENEVSGLNRNDWGEEAVARFKHINGTPFMFNFHFLEYGDKPNGHTLIIGGTGAGKTTFTQFLMANLFKYDIDIFAMDKLRGMCAFTQYVNGEYHDSDELGFKFNPFSLEYSSENLAFLELWLGFMAGIKEEEHEAKNEIQKTLKRLYLSKKEGQTISLDDFIMSLPANQGTNLKLRFESYKDSIFNNKEDALNFEKQLSVLNMDSILTDKKIASLSAMYIFHKLKNKAKNYTHKRGFFCFIDELKDYLTEPTMSKKILEAILEVRKLGGVMCMGFQTIELFKEIPYGSTFINNIANFIIFPTNNQKELESLEEVIGLTPTELKFLATTSQNERKFLNKMKLRDESAYLDADLSRLGSHLKCFSSSSDNVMLIKELQKEFPTEWRKHYLRITNDPEEFQTRILSKQQNEREVLKEDKQITKEEE